MLICGVKLSHDGSIALIDHNRLVFSYEMEKINNAPRHSLFNISLEEVKQILVDHGYRFEQIDQLVIDGWNRESNPPTERDQEASINIEWQSGAAFTIGLADYGSVIGDEAVLEAETYAYPEHGLFYKSYRHVAGHLFGAYCSSPFARRGESTTVLVWDGGMPPQLFYYDYATNRVENLGVLFPVLGSIYVLFPYEFEPFNQAPLSLSIAGKAMAYIALGNVREELLTAYRNIVEELEGEMADQALNFERAEQFTITMIGRFAALKSEGYASVDMLTSFHFFFEELLLERMRSKVGHTDKLGKNLCFSGGSALNIKWNSALRESGLFEQVWVPPFPNDSGSAIGTACCEMIARTGERALDWSVYSGPPMTGSTVLAPWKAEPCSLQQLAQLLHESAEPIVFLNGKAEIGPRALGNRSILASAAGAHMKTLMNHIKEREAYRPVAPICLEQDAEEIFSPGTSDPYMLYDHQVRPDWVGKIPAVLHLDGTARLQTVTQTQNAEIFELLSEYKKLSGIPLLCNTSANLKGSGFFPNVQSVMEWGRVNYIWSDEQLYKKIIPHSFPVQ